MQSLSRLSLHCIFRSSWILELMEVMLQTTSKVCIFSRGVKNTSFGVLPCLEEEAHTYITYGWKRANMMEWHERWDDPANKKTWDDTYEGWQIPTAPPFFSGFSRSHLNRVKQAVLQMNQSSNNCPKLLHLNAPVTFWWRVPNRKATKPVLVDHPTFAQQIRLPEMTFSRPPVTPSGR